MLHAENISKKYNEKYIVDNINLNLDFGDFVSIMGKSGSGKTTLLNIIAGTLKPDGGSVIIDGVNIHKLNDDQSSYFRNKKIGYIPQGNSLLPNFTAVENIYLPYFLHVKKSDKEKEKCMAKAEKLLYDIGIDYLKNKYPSCMSGGEMRKIAILRSLICEPKLIIADEPTNDLDEESTKDIMKLFTQINKNGATLLLVTHDKEVSHYAKNNLKMSFGKINNFNDCY